MEQHWGDLGALVSVEAWTAFVNLQGLMKFSRVETTGPGNDLGVAGGDVVSSGSCVL